MTVAETIKTECVKQQAQALSRREAKVAQELEGFKTNDDIITGLEKQIEVLTAQNEK